MIRVLFLLLIGLNLVAFAQTQEKKEPVKFFEYGKISDKLLKEKLVEFGKKLEPNSIGFIINYGTDKEIAQREQQIQRTLDSRCDFDCPRITIVSGGTCQTLKTEVWIVSPDAGNPPVCGAKTALVQKPETRKLEEFGEVSDRYFKDIFNGFFERVKQSATTNGYIVMRGTENEIKAFENRIRNLEFFEFYNSDRIIFLRKVGNPSQATVALWLVPQGQEYRDELNNK